MEGNNQLNGNNDYVKQRTSLDSVEKSKDSTGVSKQKSRSPQKRKNKESKDLSKSAEQSNSKNKNKNKKKLMWKEKLCEYINVESYKKYNVENTHDDPNYPKQKINCRCVIF